MIHELKIKSEYFEKVVDLEKRFEVRKNDRDFQPGDFVALNEIDATGTYTGRCVLMAITYILDNDEYCKKGTIIMTIEPCDMRVNIQRAFSGGKARARILDRETVKVPGMWSE